jgi:hypothetical protein
MRDIGLSHPASDAIPPISASEALGCDTAICRIHGGERLGKAYGDMEGRVLYCPLGGSFYRYTDKRDAMHTPLTWPKGM